MHDHEWDDDTEDTYCTKCDMIKSIYAALQEIKTHLLRGEWDAVDNAIYDLLECDQPLD